MYHFTWSHSCLRDYRISPCQVYRRPGIHGCFYLSIFFAFPISVFSIPASAFSVPAFSVPVFTAGFSVFTSVFSAVFSAVFTADFSAFSAFSPAFSASVSSASVSSASVSSAFYVSVFATGVPSAHLLHVHCCRDDPRLRLQPDRVLTLIDGPLRG
jgi:hypothetical protein